MKAVMYHYVRPDDPSFPFFRHIGLSAFEQQLDYFAREHRLLTRNEFIRSVEAGEPVPGGVVLTFDDGLKDHYDHVFPVLMRRGLFAIFYISAYPYLTGKTLDVHRTHLLLGRFGGRAVWESLQSRVSEGMLSHAHVQEYQQQTYRNQTNDDYTNHVKRTLNYYIDYQYRGAVIDDLMAEFFPAQSQLANQLYLSVSEVREMHEAGMILGSHTVNHPCLSKLSRPEQQEEITRSFEFLEQTLGPLDPKTFCYPYGGFHSFTPDTERLLNEAGCLFSFNVEQRDINAEDLRSRRQALPRYDCNRFPPIKKN